MTIFSELKIADFLGLCVASQGCHKIVKTKFHTHQSDFEKLRRRFMRMENVFVKFHDFSMNFCSNLKIP